MRRVRGAIAADALDRARRSSLICARLILEITRRLDGPAEGLRLLTYEALAGEPDLDDLIAWAAPAGVDVFVPVVDGPDLRVVPGDVAPATLGVVVVPGLAFTADGHRLGQGGGHFDRFLPRLSPGCLRIGVGFGEQVVDVLPLEPHDVVVDIVVTDA